MITGLKTPALPFAGLKVPLKQFFWRVSAGFSTPQHGRQGLSVPGASAFAASLAHNKHEILKLLHMGHIESHRSPIMPR